MTSSQLSPRSSAAPLTWLWRRDCSSKKPAYFDPNTGERIECELVAAVLGASSLTYAEASASQRREDFLRSRLRAHAYFGGVPRLWVAC